jgi:hypothetical protein
VTQRARRSSSAGGSVAGGGASAEVLMSPKHDAQRQPALTATSVSWIVIHTPLTNSGQ